MATRYRQNFLAGVVSGLINSTGQTTITGTNFPVIPAGQYMPIVLNPGYYGSTNVNGGPEIIYVSSVTSGVATVTRGQEGTSTTLASGTTVPWIAGNLTSDFTLGSGILNGDFPAPSSPGQLFVSTTTTSGQFTNILPSGTIIPSGVTISSGVVISSGVLTAGSNVSITNIGSTTTITVTGVTTSSVVITGTVGQITGGGTIGSNQTFGLATAGTAGTYGTSSGIPIITTDSYGRVTNVSVTGVAATNNYLAISGGTISGNLTVASGLTVSGALNFVSPSLGGIVATSGQSAVWNGTKWAPATISGGTTSGNYLPTSGGTISGNLVVASGLTISGAITTSSEVDTGDLTVGGNITITGTSIQIGNGTFNNNLTISGTTTTSNLTVKNNTTVSGNLSISGTITATSGSIANNVVAVPAINQLGVIGSYTTVAADANQLVLISNALTSGIAIPLNTYSNGASINFLQTGTQTNCVISGATGVTIYSKGFSATLPVLNGQFSAATAIQYGNNTWVVFGDIV